MIRLPGRRARAEHASAVRRDPLILPRADAVDRLAAEAVDVLVIGGGITGAYCALDAVTRGLRVALVERDDVASGTSSRSSKMVHGGLRYIEQGNLPLVRHSLLERQRLRRNAPHLVQRLPFLFPILTHDGVLDARLAKAFEAVLWTYDISGGWRIGRLHRRLSVAEVLARAPQLPADRLRGGFLYYDGRTDDARLTLAVARTAAHFGAVVLNGAECIDVRRSSGVISGATVRCDGREVEVSARTVINATGVWADRIDRLLNPAHEPQLRPAKGVHIVLPWQRLPIDCTVTVPVPGRARRATCTRWGDVVVMGTTDEDYEGSIDSVLCTRKDAQFLIEGTNQAFGTDLTIDDIVGSIAGLRPLVGKHDGATLTMSRDHHITADPAGFVTVTGGKLTTGRHMAELAVDAVVGLLGRSERSRTVKQPLLGGFGFGAEASTATGGLAAHLGERYGTEATFVRALIAEDPALSEPLVAGLPHVAAEVVYAARCELARSVDDVLTRRIRARLFARDASVDAAPTVGRLLQRELGLTDPEVSAQVAEYQESVAHERAVLLGVD